MSNSVGVYNLCDEGLQTYLSPSRFFSKRTLDVDNFEFGFLAFIPELYQSLVRGTSFVDSLWQYDISLEKNPLGYNYKPEGCNTRSALCRQLLREGLSLVSITSDGVTLYYPVPDSNETILVVSPDESKETRRLFLSSLTVRETTLVVPALVYNLFLYSLHCISFENTLCLVKNQTTLTIYGRPFECDFDGLKTIYEAFKRKPEILGSIGHALNVNPVGMSLKGFTISDDANQAYALDNPEYSDMVMAATSSGRGLYDYKSKRLHLISGAIVSPKIEFMTLAAQNEIKFYRVNLLDKHLLLQ